MGRPTASPGHDFWKGDNDNCDCNLICCGYQSKHNVAPAVQPATQPAMHSAPPAQQMAAPQQPQEVAVGQPVFHEPGPVKPGNTGYPTAN